jgi:oxygen-independent coproporphyrinogen-3 oxidase
MHAPAIFDRELIQRYDTQGPRYTSYPTAVQFHDQFDASSYRQAVAHANGDPIPVPLSLYFHIPFCATVCFYCACNKIVTKNRQRAEEYLQRLIREVEYQAALFEGTRKVSQLHWGGGTPTYLSREQMSRLMTATRDCFDVIEGDEAEISIEVDPRTVTPDDIGFLREIGFNRISLGVQDLDPNVQVAINRIQTPEQTGAIIDAARRAGFLSLSVDLIYGLPMQSVATFDRTLDWVIDARPDRISVFNYAHLPHLFKVQRQIDETRLPSAEQKLRMLSQAVNKLRDAGYVYIGMDHFALPDDELAVAQDNGTLSRNFQGYATHGDCDIVGMGVSSISRIGNCYAQNDRDPASYQARIDAGELAVFRGVELNGDDSLRREVIMQLACHFELDFARFERNYGIDFHRYFGDELQKLVPFQMDGLVSLTEDSLTVSPRGRLLIRNICMVFDRYLARDEAARARFSRVV